MTGVNETSSRTELLKTCDFKQIFMHETCGQNLDINKDSLLMITDNKMIFDESFDPQ